MSSLPQSNESERPVSIDVVIPTTRPLVQRLIWGLAHQTVRPDRVFVVSNEIDELDPMGLDLALIGFSSEHYPIGAGDAGLRRNIGFWQSTSDYIVTLDDDQAVPATLIEKFVAELQVHRVVWGHHRYIDFDQYSLDQLLTLDPRKGRSRELYVNDLHGWQSCYGGCMGAERSLLLEVGGYDMVFLGRHANEDQNLGRRLLHYMKQGDRVWIYEPPFAWHPTRVEWHGGPVTNLCGGDELNTIEINGFRFEVCPRCPYRRCLEDTDRLFGDDIVVPFEPDLVTLNIQHIGETADQ